MHRECKHTWLLFKYKSTAITLLDPQGRSLLFYLYIRSKGNVRICDILVRLSKKLKRQSMFSLPDAHQDPQSEPFSCARSSPSGIWLQLLSHWGGKTLNRSLEMRDGFLLPYCMPDPSAELIQLQELSHLSTREKVNLPLWCGVVCDPCSPSWHINIFLSPVSYRQRLTMPSLQGKPVLLCSCSFIFPLMKLFKYSSVCTHLSKSLEAISGTHTYCEEGNLNSQQYMTDQFPNLLITTIVN